MLMWMAIVLLSLLFIISLFLTLFNPQTKIFMAWSKSYFTNNKKALPQHVESTDQSPAGRKPGTVDKAELKRVFATFDKNDDGFITKQELRDSLRNIGIYMSEGEVEEMVEKVDSNGDGLIDIGEFYELFEAVMGGREEAVGGGSEEEDEEEGAGGGEGDLKEAFDVFDGDRDGLISVVELGLVLSSLGMKEGQGLENCKEMIRQVDMDGDGMVNFDEFKKMMKAGGRLVAVS